MKIVFMGTPDFASGILKALFEAGYEIAGVVTQPDRPKGRKKELVPSPVKEEALKIGCPILQPLKIRDEEAVKAVLELGADAIVVAAFGQIIPKAILEAPRYGCLNVHASLLPSYRGASPIQTALADGCAETGVTIMQMDEGLDTGDVISQAVVEIATDETGGSLFDKLAAEGAALLIETLKAIEAGTAVRTPQPKESPTPYCRMLKKEQGRIDWTKPAKEIERLIRAMDPWPSAFTSLDGKTLKIWKAHVVKEEERAGSGDCGRIVRQDRKGIYVRCAEGILCLDEVQMEGRKRLMVSEFVKGYVIRNDRLG